MTGKHLSGNPAEKEPVAPAVEGRPVVVPPVDKHSENGYSFSTPSAPENIVDFLLLLPGNQSKHIKAVPSFLDILDQLHQGHDQHRGDVLEDTVDGLFIEVINVLST